MLIDCDGLHLDGFVLLQTMLIAMLLAQGSQVIVMTEWRRGPCSWLMSPRASFTSDLLPHSLIASFHGRHDFRLFESNDAFPIRMRVKRT